MNQEISAEWTAEERLMVVSVLMDMIRDDIHANRYGVVGRPNIQSVHEFIVAPAYVLEEHRAQLDALIEEWGKWDEFWERRPSELWVQPELTVV